MADFELIYVGDPMCSWCWGFVPVLRRLEATYALPLRVVVGGLAVSEAVRTLDARTAASIAEHWHHVAEASGQPFDFGTLDRHGWRYDSEPACTAVVAMRTIAPERTLSYMERLQRAFYAEGVDITVAETCATLAGELEEQVLASMARDETRRATWKDFVWTHKSGVRGFPTLLVRDGEDWAVVTRGWLDGDVLIEGLTRWLGERHDLGEVLRG